MYVRVCVIFASVHNMHKSWWHTRHIIPSPNQNEDENNIFEKESNIDTATSNSQLTAPFIMLSPRSKFMPSTTDYFFLYCRNSEFPHMKAKDIMHSQCKNLHV